MGWDNMEEPPRTHVGKRETVGGNQRSGALHSPDVHPHDSLNAHPPPLEVGTVIPISQMGKTEPQALGPNSDDRWLIWDSDWIRLTLWAMSPAPSEIEGGAARGPERGKCPHFFKKRGNI